MKTILVAALLSSTVVSIHAQNNAAVRPQNTPYAIVSRDANSRVWQRTNWTQDASAEWLPHVDKITELSTGLCHKDDNGKYVDSSEAITLLLDGTAAATNCATAVFFPADIGSGVIRLVTSDGKVLQNGPAYLAFDDGTNAIMIAAVTNSVGQLISSNQVLYADIFRGAGFRADLLCTVRKSGFESDLVFRERTPDPESLGLGTNARLELLTEWFNTPEPTRTTNAPSDIDGLTDVTLHFASAAIGQGKAFSTGTTDSHAGRLKQSDNVPVYKSWIHSKNGQTFLVEAVPYRRLAPKLKQLPARFDASAKSSWHKLFIAQDLPSRPRLQESAKGIQLAKAEPSHGLGVVLDYVEVNGDMGDYTFSPGTYFVSGPAYCANGIIQGGAIFKYPNDTSSFLQIDNVTCQTGPYNPAIFTAADDDSVGESMNGVWSGYTGGISEFGYANPAPLVNTGNLRDLRIRYAQNAIYISNPANLRVTDTQIAACGVAVYVDDAASCSITLENCLIGDGEAIAEQTMGFVGNSSCGINLYNCTIDNIYPLVDGSASVYAVNSVFSDVGDFGNGSLSGGYNGFVATPGTFGDHAISSGCDISELYYAPILHGNTGDGYGYGVGNYYLACGDFRNAGTSDTGYILDTSVLADIATKSTQPPSSAGYTTYPASVTFGIVNPGDTSPTPDLGYHYDRLDYVFCENEVAAKAHLTFSQGTAVGWCLEPSYNDYPPRHENTGIWLDYPSSLAFNGTPDNPCYFVDCRTVWDIPNRNGGGTAIAVSSANGGAVLPTFTQFCTLDDDATFFGSSGKFNSVEAYNCEFWNGTFCQNNTGLILILVDCLVNEPGLSFLSGRSAPDSYFSWNNCTFEGFNEIQRYNSAWQIYIENCAFDGYVYGIGGPYSGNISCNYNAYLEGSPHNRMAGADDVTVSAFNWQTGPLGNFYLPNDPPANDGTLLIDGGSDSIENIALSDLNICDLNLTTQTDGRYDCGTVDIGYHYPAWPIFSPYAFWEVTDITQAGNPKYLGKLQGPFSSAAPGQYCSPYNGCICELSKTYWPPGTDQQPSMWSNHTTVNLTGDLSFIGYSIAIDNDFALSINGKPITVSPYSGLPVDDNGFVDTDGGPGWSSPVAHLPNIHPGENSLDVIIRDRGDVSCFAMQIVRTACQMNHPPTANPQTASVIENTAQPITLTGSDPDSDYLTYSVVQGEGPVHGTLSGTPPNLVYTPNIGYLGNDSFTFTCNDGLVDSAPAVISITVTAP